MRTLHSEAIVRSILFIGLTEMTGVSLERFGGKTMEYRLICRGSYSDREISVKVQQNLDFARANMKSNIYDQAILEGVATSFPQTEDIIDNGIVNGMTATDVQKILNLKHAWEFVLDRDVIAYPTDYSILCYIAKLVNEGFFQDGGRIRGVPVKIGGSSYVPPLPIETIVKEQLSEILQRDMPSDEKAIGCAEVPAAGRFEHGSAHWRSQD